MDLSHTSGIATKESQKILREIIFVDFVQCAHDAEIQRDVAAVACYQDVSGMHIGMKKAVTEYLREENLHARARQLRHIDALLAQAFHLADGRTGHALHDHDLGAAKIPKHFWNEQQR